MSLNSWINNPWVNLCISILIVAAAATLGRWMIRLILDKVLGRLAVRTKGTLDNAILAAVRPLLNWFIVIAALELAVNRLSFINPVWQQKLGDGFFVFYILLAFLLIWRLVDNIFSWYIRGIAVRTETNLAEQILPFLRRLAFILLFVIVMITVMHHFNLEISALVTTLGIGSLAVALAAQESLSDTFSGFMIMLDRPFRIGDRIELQDLDTWGDVTDIGLRSTRIRTMDNRLVSVPNSVIGKSLIVNHSFPDTNYRIQTEVGVAYGSDLDLVQKVITETIMKVEGVLNEEPIEVLFLEFGDSSLNFRIRWWIESYNDMRYVLDRANMAIYKAFNQTGIAIPFPQRDVNHKIDVGDVGIFRQITRDNN
jgi:MscS family membrane protein